MNFDHVNKVSDYVRHKLYPHLNCRMQVADFGNYLSKMAESNSFKWMRSDLKALPIPYFLDPIKFSSKYAKKCVAFTGTSSPQDGSLNIIYQITPTFHVLARLYHWVELEEIKAYLTLTVAFKDFEEYLEFFDSNSELRMVGNTEDRAAGFSAGKQMSGSDLGALFKQVGFSAAKQPAADNTEFHDDPDDEP